MGQGEYHRDCSNGRCRKNKNAIRVYIYTYVHTIGEYLVGILTQGNSTWYTSYLVGIVSGYGCLAVVTYILV